VLLAHGLGGGRVGRAQQAQFGVQVAILPRGALRRERADLLFVELKDGRDRGGGLAAEASQLGGRLQVAVPGRSEEKSKWEKRASRINPS
jgi:hypothetical protein